MSRRIPELVRLGCFFAFMTGASAATMPDWSAAGSIDGARFGVSLAVGDFDGDGFKDLAVGAPEEPPGGAVHVFRGSTEGFSKTPRWSLRASQTNAFFGQALLALPDNDGDGCSDLLVAAPSFRSFDRPVGWVGEYRGGRNGLNVSPGWELKGPPQGINFGRSIAYVADAGNRYQPMLLVGIPGLNEGRSHAGGAWLLNRNRGGFDPLPTWHFVAENSDGHAGYAVAAIGDLNRDGWPDIMVGAPDFHQPKATSTGKAHVFFGGANGFPPTPSYSIEGHLPELRLGSTMAGGKDLDGDGHDDVLLAAPTRATQNVYKGRVVLLDGNLFGPILPKYRGLHGKAGDLFGASVALIGDINGDGASEFAIGDPEQSDGADRSGKVRIYPGRADFSNSVPVMTIDGGAVRARFGRLLLAPGDIDGDGLPDLLIGSPHMPGPAGSGGRVDLILGLPERFKTPSQWDASGPDGYRPFRPGVEQAKVPPISLAKPSLLGAATHPANRTVMIASGLSVVVIVSVLAVFLRRRAVRNREAALVKAREDERRKVSREIHDHMGPVITRAILAGAEGGDGKTHMKKVVGEVMDEFQLQTWSLRPESENLGSLAAFLTRSVREILKDAPVRLVPPVGEVPPVPVGREALNAVPVIVREIANNCVRHANASLFRLELSVVGQEFEIVTTDDGQGFDPSSVPPTSSGLASMRLRASGMGGSIQIDSASGRGTTHRLRWPHMG